MQAVWANVLESIEGKGGALDALLIQDEKGNINHVAMLVVIGVPIIMLFCICYVVADSEGP